MIQTRNTHKKKRVQFEEWVYKVTTARRFESRDQSGSFLTKGKRGYNTLKLCYCVHLLTNLFLRSREEKDEIRRQTNKLPSSISLPGSEKCCFLGCSLLLKKWQNLKKIRLLIYGSRPRKWKQFAYAKYIRTKITIKKFLFKSELAGSRKIKVGSFTEIEISIFVDNSTRLFNGTLINKQRNKRVNKLKKKTFFKKLFLLGAVLNDGRTKFHIYGAYHDFQRLPHSSYVFCGWIN